jgi:hypothetical protein
MWKSRVPAEQPTAVLLVCEWEKFETTNTDLAFLYPLALQVQITWLFIPKLEQNPHNQVMLTYYYNNMLTSPWL